MKVPCGEKYRCVCYATSTDLRKYTDAFKSLPLNLVYRLITQNESSGPWMSFHLGNDRFTKACQMRGVRPWVRAPKTSWSLCVYVVILASPWLGLMLSCHKSEWHGFCSNLELFASDKLLIASNPLCRVTVMLKTRPGPMLRGYAEHIYLLDTSDLWHTVRESSSTEWQNGWWLMGKCLFRAQGAVRCERSGSSHTYRLWFTACTYCTCYQRVCLSAVCKKAITGCLSRRCHRLLYCDVKIHLSKNTHACNNRQCNTCTHKKE